MITYTCNYCGATEGDSREWYEVAKKKPYRRWHFCSTVCMRSHFNYWAGVTLPAPVVEEAEDYD